MAERDRVRLIKVWVVQRGFPVKIWQTNKYSEQRESSNRGLRGEQTWCVQNRERRFWNAEMWQIIHKTARKR